jgi:Family of unknown function (DUF6884)
MSTIFLLSCVSKKRAIPLPARDLYMSNWFLMAKTYVEKFGMPWFILSAKYGLVDPDTTIEPYDETLNNFSKAQRRVWAQRVINQMETTLPQADSVILFAGLRYREFLMNYVTTRFAKVEVPLEKLRIGEQLQWFSRR